VKKDVLCRPFPPELIKQRQGQGGKTLSYVETHAVIARLNEGCEAWSFEIVEHQILEEEVVVVAKLTADGVTKMAFGGSAITRDREGHPVSIADDAKAAGSDALKKAASLLGVALELYGGSAPAIAPVSTPHAPRPAQPADRLTGRQYSALQSITRRHNIASDDLTSMLEERFQKADLGHLTRREASSLLSELTNANGNHT
jgi:hypothetical protein